MQQPPGFVDPSKPTHLCRFHKAIVGLRQAQLACFQRFSTYLLQSGFRQSVADTSIYLSSPFLYWLYRPFALC